MAELQRRNVVRVAVFYLVVAWLVAQIAEVVIGLAGLPASVGRAVLIILALGFPIALVLSWWFEWTPSGIHRDTGGEAEPVAPSIGLRRSDPIIMLLMAVALAYFALTHDWSNGPPETASIAVLPFEHRGAGSDDAYFTDGLHDELLTRLSKISALMVISRSSVMRFREGNRSLPEIAQELGVTNILEGGVQRAGERIRLNLQLTEAQSGRHLWAETYDRTLSAENVFEIQSEVAAAVVQALGARLLPGERERLDTLPTRNLDAYDDYLLGQKQLATRDPTGVAGARGYFLRAIQKDPEFALAHAGLSYACSLLASYEPDRGPQHLAESERAARIALSLDAQLGEAHTALGILKKIRGDKPAAYAEDLRHGIEFAPGSADAHKWYANYLSTSGQSQQALIHYRKAVELDPLSPIVRVNLGEILMALGRKEEARSAFVRALEIDPGFLPALWFVMGHSPIEEALKVNSAAYSNQVRDPWLLLHFVFGYLDAGDADRAAEWVDVMEAGYENSQPTRIARLNLSFYRDPPEDWSRHAETLLPFERGGMPMPSRLLLIRDLQSGDLDAPWVRYQQKYPDLFLENPALIERYPVAVDLALLMLKRGDTDRARGLLDRVVDLMDQESELGFEDPRIVRVRALTLRGDKGPALDALAAALADGWRERWWIYLERDPALESLRAEPRFIHWLEGLRATAADQLDRIRAAETSGEIVLPR